MRKYNLFRYAQFLLITLFVLSCERNNDDNQKVQGDYLYDYELLNSYTNQEVKSKLALGAFVFQGLDTLVSSSEYGVDVYRVLYNTSFKSEEILASGLVCVPISNGAFPVVSFQNGTNTCHENAPSENPTATFYSLISVMAGSGYVITIPDYIGFGESDYILHPYHHKESSNSSIIDLLMAAEELIESHIVKASLNKDLYLIGYSQGGWATMSVLKELEQSTMHGYTTKAAACGAGAYNLTEMSRHVLGLEEYGTPFYLPYFMESRRQNSILNDPLISYFKQPYADEIPGLFEGDNCNTNMNSQLTPIIGDLLTEDFISNFETAGKYELFRTELKTNSVSAWDLKAKVRMYHSTGDKSVPSFLSDNMYNEFISKGVDPQKITLVKAELLDNKAEYPDHNEAIFPWGIDALTWLNTLEGK